MCAILCLTSPQCNVTMKTAFFYTSACMLALGAAPGAAAQAIDMSGAHSVTLASSTAAVPAASSPVAPQHAPAPLWTRMVVEHDAQGNMRAVCSVQPNPQVAESNNPDTPTTTTNLPSL